MKYIFRFILQKQNSKVFHGKNGILVKKLSIFFRNIAGIKFEGVSCWKSNFLFHLKHRQACKITHRAIFMLPVKGNLRNKRNKFQLSQKCIFIFSLFFHVFFPLINYKRGCKITRCYIPEVS